MDGRVNYRRSESRDCQSVYSLICELEACVFDYEKFEAIYENQQKSGQYYCLVSESEGTVVGVLNLRFEDQLHHAARVAEIMEFLVRPQYRSRGIGKEMLGLAGKIAKDHGCCVMEVTSGQQRTDAHRFYMREGMSNSHFKFTIGL